MLCVASIRQVPGLLRPFQWRVFPFEEPHVVAGNTHWDLSEADVESYRLVNGG
jgi:hypothetical protein